MAALSHHWTEIVCARQRGRCASVRQPKTTVISPVLGAAETGRLLKSTLMCITRTEGVGVTGLRLPSTIRSRASRTRSCNPGGCGAFSDSKGDRGRNLSATGIWSVAPRTDGRHEPARFQNDRVESPDSLGRAIEAKPPFGMSRSTTGFLSLYGVRDRRLERFVGSAGSVSQISPRFDRQVRVISRRAGNACQVRDVHTHRTPGPQPRQARSAHHGPRCPPASTTRVTARLRNRRRAAIFRLARAPFPPVPALCDFVQPTVWRGKGGPCRHQGSLPIKTSH